MFSNHQDYFEHEVYGTALPLKACEVPPSYFMNLPHCLMCLCSVPGANTLNLLQEAAAGTSQNILSIVTELKNPPLPGVPVLTALHRLWLHKLRDESSCC